MALKKYMQDNWHRAMAAAGLVLLTQGFTQVSGTKPIETLRSMAPASDEIATSLVDTCQAWVSTMEEPEKNSTPPESGLQRTRRGVDVVQVPPNPIVPV